MKNPERHVPLIALVALASLALTGCGPPATSSAPPILLFNGTGTSANDVAAIETVLNDTHLNYSTVNSPQLNRLGESQLMANRVLIVPGGNFIAIGDGLTSATTARIHDAVQNGLNYLGICAGGFLAGHGSYNSLNLTSDVLQLLRGREWAGSYCPFLTTKTARSTRPHSRRDPCAQFYSGQYWRWV